MQTYWADSTPADSIAAAISYATGQPAEVDVSELVIHPTRQR
jgi:NADP-dependent 3-hydroxy acid dehydrogenase YdfG